MDDNSTNTGQEASAPGVYVVAAHPNWRESRVNRLLFDAAHGLRHVHPHDLYASYPDYNIHVQREQERLAAAQLVVLMHPVQWYSMPALLKLWLDEVLVYDWAYGTNGKALRGKDLWLVATTGGPEESYHPNSYNRYFFDAFLPPYEQTAALCGMRFLPPLIMHAAHSASEQEVHDHVDVFRQRLHSYPHWPEIDELNLTPACEVPATDRPQD